MSKSTKIPQTLQALPPRIKISRRHDSQWKRYFSKFGQIAISKINPKKAFFIPVYAPCVSVDLSRSKAAGGLIEWRKKFEEPTSWADIHRAA